VLPFEHYSTIKRIIITLCSKNEALEKELRHYEDALRGFTMSKAMGSAKFYDENPCSNEAQDMVELIITTNSSWNECPVLLNVLDLEDTIAKVFQCEIFALHLRSIDNEPQSVTLCFALSYNILKSVFPLTTEEWISVTNHGVVELKCLEFDYNIIMQEKATMERLSMEEMLSSKYHFLQFGTCLGKEGGVLQEIWQKAMGRYDRAMKNLVVDVLNETENPVENLVQSLEKMTSDSSQKAAETIQKVIISVDCLTVLLEHYGDTKPLGILLGFQEDMVEAIWSYYGYEDKGLINRHMINLWLISCPLDPVRQLRDALNELKKVKASQQLLLLSSLGMYVKLSKTMNILKSQYFLQT
jgi:hypothetical protein